MSLHCCGMGREWSAWDWGWDRGVDKHLELLEVLGDNHFELGILSEDFTHLIGIQPLDVFDPVDMGVHPGLYDERGRTIGSLGPLFEGILHLQCGLDVEVERGDEIS